MIATHTCIISVKQTNCHSCSAKFTTMLFAVIRIDSPDLLDVPRRIPSQGCCARLCNADASQSTWTSTSISGQTTSATPAAESALVQELEFDWLLQYPTPMIVLVLQSMLLLPFSLLLWKVGLQWIKQRSLRNLPGPPSGSLWAGTVELMRSADAPHSYLLLLDFKVISGRFSIQKGGNSMTTSWPRTGE